MPLPDGPENHHKFARIEFQAGREEHPPHLAAVGEITSDVFELEDAQWSPPAMEWINGTLEAGSSFEGYTKRHQRTRQADEKRPCREDGATSAGK